MSEEFEFEINPKWKDDINKTGPLPYCTNRCPCLIKEKGKHLECKAGKYSRFSGTHLGDLCFPAIHKTIKNYNNLKDALKREI